MDKMVNHPDMGIQKMFEKQNSTLDFLHLKTITLPRKGSTVLRACLIDLVDTLWHIHLAERIKD